MNNGRSEDLYSRGSYRLPADLEPRILEPGRFRPVPVGKDGRIALAEDDPIMRIIRNTDVLASDRLLEKGYLGRNVSITTTPTRVIDGQFQRGYLLLNPTLSAGLTTSGVLFSLLARAPGTYTTELAPLGVANYQRMALFLNITANATPLALTVSAESRDQTSLNWVLTQADVFGGQNLVFAVNTAGYYANLGNFGIDIEFALRAIVGAGAGACTFGVNYVLKDGLAGSSTGVATTIFLGGPNVNSTTGVPLLAGRSFPLRS